MELFSYHLLSSSTCFNLFFFFQTTHNYDVREYPQRHSGPFVVKLLGLVGPYSCASKLTFNVLKQLKTSVVDRSTLRVGIITCLLSSSILSQRGFGRSFKPLRNHCTEVVLLIPCFTVVLVNIQEWEDQLKVNFIT